MKRIATATTILLSLLALAACGGSSTTSEPAQAPASTPPAISSGSNSAPVIAGTIPSGKENKAYQLAFLISDSDGDPVSLSVTNLPTWLSFDAETATLTGTPDKRNLGLHTSIEIVATDGESETRRVFDIDVAYDELEQALRSGNSSYVETEHVLLDGILKTVENDRTKFAAVKNQLFALDQDGTPNSNSLTNVSWDPTHDAALLKSRFGSNLAILTSNSVTNRSYALQQHALGIVGQTQTSRYAVFGSNPMRNYNRSDAALSGDMIALVDNTLDWLANTDDAASGPLNIVLAQLDQSFYFPDQVAVREWLERKYGDRVTFNDAQSCNGDRLDACIIDSTDLLIISQRLFDSEEPGLIATHVQQAMRAGVAVMYLHYDGDNGKLAKELLPLFNVDYHGDNYWRKLSIENYDAGAATSKLPNDVTKVSELINRFKAQSFISDLSLCEDTSCPNDHPYNDEFLAPAETLQGQLWALDKQGIRLFESGDYRYQKLLVLLGDYYRQRVRFPMDRDVTVKTLFLRSLFADHTAYYSRDFNRVQRDMGNFSRGNFSHISPKSRRVSTTSKSPFRASGAYALPGVPFTVTRHDFNDVSTSVFINTLRPGATHQFDQYGYSRPKYLTSSKFNLAPGQSLTLTSPFGGPIQIQYGANDIPVEIEFTQIGEHPYWASSDDDATFMEALEAGDYDWAELITPGFEVHSTLEKMRETMAIPTWGSASAVSEAITRYTYNYPHSLAGLRGPGIDIDPEIHDFAQAHGLEIDMFDGVKHMNADQATCGYGCSGNPYDAYWSFDPLGHGDLHELGHGLERSRFRFAGWDGHASTNPYSYYSKFRYFENTGDTGVLKGCQNLPFEKLFEIAQSSKKSSDPIAYMQEADLTGWSEGSTIYLQLMMRLQSDHALASGWNLLPRLQIVEREFSRADDSDEVWLAKRDGMGFAGIARTDARRLSNNDWLLIALSHVTGRDLREYLTMWGLTHTDSAANHVKAMTLPVLPVALHTLDSNAYCLGLNHPSVPVDGNQVWPAGT